MALLYIFIILVACALLIKSAQLIIQALHYLASYLKISEFVLSFILIGLITSLPELFVGIFSALHQESTLSLGNVLGSNIANICIGVGLVAILSRGIKIETKTIKQNIVFALLIISYPVVLLLDHHLSRIDAVALLITFGLYNMILYRQSERFEKKVRERVFRRDLIKHILIFLFGITILIISSEMIVRSAKAISVIFNVPSIFIGLFIIAIGTSLPEIGLMVKAAMEKRQEIILGAILGTIVFNMTAILGITAIIHPIQITNSLIFTISAGFMLIVTTMFWLFSISKEKISWLEGIVLISFYLIFIALEFWVKKG